MVCIPPGRCWVPVLSLRRGGTEGGGNQQPVQGVMGAREGKRRPPPSALGGLEDHAAVTLPCAGRVQTIPVLLASLGLVAGAARAVAGLPRLHTGV